jgi:hypothetical protein
MADEKSQACPICNRPLGTPAQHYAVTIADGGRRASCRPLSGWGDTEDPWEFDPFLLPPVDRAFWQSFVEFVDLPTRAVDQSYCFSKWTITICYRAKCHKKLEGTVASVARKRSSPTPAPPPAVILRQRRRNGTIKPYRLLFLWHGEMFEAQAELWHADALSWLMFKGEPELVSRMESATRQPWISTPQAWLVVNHLEGALSKDLLCFRRWHDDPDLTTSPKGKPPVLNTIESWLAAGYLRPVTATATVTVPRQSTPRLRAGEPPLAPHLSERQLTHAGHGVERAMAHLQLRGRFLRGEHVGSVRAGGDVLGVRQQP